MPSDAKVKICGLALEKVANFITTLKHLTAVSGVQSSWCREQAKFYLWVSLVILPIFPQMSEIKMK